MKKLLNCLFNLILRLLEMTVWCGNDELDANLQLNCVQNRDVEVCQVECWRKPYHAYPIQPKAHHLGSMSITPL